MKFETKKNKFNNKWRYMAQFENPTVLKRATSWLASRTSDDFAEHQVFFYTNSLQDIFEMRLFFEHYIKVVRASEQP
jgi:hypothetical protein